MPSFDHEILSVWGKLEDLSFQHDTDFVVLMSFEKKWNAIDSEVGLEMGIEIWILNVG